MHFNGVELYNDPPSTINDSWLLSHEISVPGFEALICASAPATQGLLCPMSQNDRKTYDGTHKRNYPLLILVGLGLCALDVFCLMRYWDWRAHDLGSENAGTVYGLAAFILVWVAPLMVWMNAKAWYMERLFGQVKVHLSATQVRIGDKIDLHLSVRSQHLGHLRAQAKFITYQRRHKSPEEIEKESYTYLSGHGNAQVLVAKYEDTPLLEHPMGNTRGAVDDRGRFVATFSYLIPLNTHPTGHEGCLEYFSEIQYTLSSEQKHWRGKQAIQVLRMQR